MECPYCGEIVWIASAWDGGEPDYEPGWLCPACGEFVSDDEAEDWVARQREAEVEEQRPPHLG